MTSQLRDGGYGWVIVGSTFVLLFMQTITWSTFGIYYMAFVEQFHESSHLIVWIHSALMCFFGLTGSISGMLVRSIGYHKLSLIGALCYVVGCLTSSFAPHLGVLILGYGVLLGLGNSFIFMSSVVAVQDYFDKRRGFASALSFCGISVSIFISSPLVQWMINNYGWRGSLLIQSAIMMNCIPAALLLVTPTPQYVQGGINSTIQDETKGMLAREVSSDISGNHDTQKTSKFRRLKTLVDIFDFSLLKNKHFTVFCIVVFTFQLGLNVPLVFQIPRAVELGTKRQTAALIASAYGIGNAMGRLPIGLLSDRCERRLLFGVLNALCGTITIICSFLTIFPVLVAYAGVLGFLSGGLILITPPTAVDLIGIEKFHKGQGLTMIFNGLSSMSAAPFAGLLYRLTNSYDMAFLIVGILMVTAGGLMALVYIVIKIRRSFLEKSKKSTYIGVALKDI